MVEELYGYHKASIRISAIDVKSSASLSGKNLPCLSCKCILCDVLKIAYRYQVYLSGSTTGGRRGAYAPPNRPAGAMLCSRNLHGTAIASCT